MHRLHRQTDHATIVGNVAAAPISGVSLAVAQASTQTAAEQAAVGTEYGGRLRLIIIMNVRSEASTDSEVVGIMKNNAVAELSPVQRMAGTRSHPALVSGYVKAEYSGRWRSGIYWIPLRQELATRSETETLKVRSEASYRGSRCDISRTGSSSLTVTG